MIRLCTLLAALGCFTACRASTGASLPDPGAFVPAAIRQHGRFGCLARRGAGVIPPRFEGARCFHEGLAAVRVGEKFGYIDTGGRVVVAPRFQFASDFSDGVAVVNQGGRWGHFGSDMPEFHGG